MFESEFETNCSKLGGLVPNFEHLYGRKLVYLGRGGLRRGRGPVDVSVVTDCEGGINAYEEEERSFNYHF